MIINTFSISGDDPEEFNLYDSYNLEHYSEIGIKFTSSNGIKITYSDRVVNYVNGRWRMALNESPFTSYYVNPSTSDSLPVSGWVNIDGDPFTGVFSITSVDEDLVIVDPDNVIITPQDTTSTSTSSVDQETPTSVEESQEQIFVPVLDVESSNMYSNELTETVIVYGRPTVTFLSHNTIITGSKYAVLVTGYSLNHTTNVYLSSNADLFPQQLINTHNDAEYPPISAHETSFDVVTENELIVNIPAVYRPGMIDIVISNPAGYGKLTPLYEPTSDNWTEENLQPYIITVDL